MHEKKRYVEASDFVELLGEVTGMAERLSGLVWDCKMAYRRLDVAQNDIKLLTIRVEQLEAELKKRG